MTLKMDIGNCNTSYVKKSRKETYTRNNIII